MSRDENKPIAWISTPLDLAENEPMTCFERCAAISDLTFGLGSRLISGEGVEAHVPMINTDTTIHFERTPVGDWIAFRNSFLHEDRGIGLAEVTLYDTQGRIGRSLQTLLSQSG